MKKRALMALPNLTATDEMKKNREGFTQYANHVLSMIASTY